MDAQNPTSQALQSSHVAMLSLLSFAARIATGFVSDFFSYHHVAKTTWSVVGSVLMTVACFLGSNTQDINTLYIVTVLTALAYGTTWTIVPILVGEYFGLVNFAKNW